MECQRRQVAKMLKTGLRQPCLHTQPSCPTSSEAAQTLCVCMMAEGDTEGDTGSQKENRSRGGQRCCQLQDAPASGTVEQQGWMGLSGGKASGSCQQEPMGLNGDTLCPSLDKDSLALVAEPAAPPECPSSASELAPAAANPSQEWKVVKIQRVLIDPAGEPRKAGKRNPLWPPSPTPKSAAMFLGPGLPLPGVAVGTPSSSQGRTSSGLEVPGSRQSCWDFFSLR